MKFTKNLFALFLIFNFFINSETKTDSKSVDIDPIIQEELEAIAN